LKAEAATLPPLQFTEKVGSVVIPSEARDLLSRNEMKKSDSSGKPHPRNDNFEAIPWAL
jgi:hypothetical protein